MPKKGQQLARYKSEEVDTALYILAMWGGNSRKAAEDLEENHGLVVAEKTLRNWRTSTHVQRYYEIVAKHGPELEDRLAQKHRENLLRIQEGVSIGVEKAIEELETGNPKDASAIARNLQVVGGIGTTNLLTLTGRPSIIEEHRTADELLRKLQSALGEVDGTAEEVEDAQLVEETEERQA